MSADEVAGIIQTPAPARLIEGGLLTERLNPLAWMTDVLTKLVNHWPASKIETEPPSTCGVAAPLTALWRPSAPALVNAAV
jgi:hypothetical protein